MGFWWPKRAGEPDSKEPKPEHGCAHCWPASADEAWEARGTLDHEADLVDESHFHVMILACPRCKQRFLSAFAETVDWVDGEDPQYWSLLPITPDETARLVKEDDARKEPSLFALGPERRCLRYDCPKRSNPRTYWVTGMRIGPHD